MKNLSDAEPLVNIEIDKGVPVSEIIGDGTAITGNPQDLYFNGLKHSFDDEVYVRVWIERYKTTRIYFSVENTGILIPPKDMPKLFEPFISTCASEENIVGTGSRPGEEQESGLPHTGGAHS